MMSLICTYLAWLEHCIVSPIPCLGRSEWRNPPKTRREFRGLLQVVIEIHANNDEPFIAVFGLNRIPPRKRTTAGNAPRCPKVENDNFALVLRKIERFVGEYR